MNHEICRRRDDLPAPIEQTQESDTILAKAVESGDHEAINTLFHRFSAWVYRFAYYHLDRNKADAEDLCSDILMTAIRSIGTFDATRGNLDAWMIGIAKHRIFQFCRRRHLHLPLIPEVFENDSNCDVGSVPSLEDTMLMRDAVNQALASLPARQAEALIGKYVDGYTTQELARLMETTNSAVESLLVRARNAFRATINALTGGDNNAE